MSSLGVPSVAANSVARLLALGGRVVFGFAGSVVTARALGPGGKGALASMLYMITLLGYACSLGLGEASAVFAAGDHERLKRAFSRSILPVGATAIAAAFLWVPGARVFWGVPFSVALVGGALVVLMTAVWLLTGFEAARERITFTSKVIGVQLACELGLLIAFVMIFDMGVGGGVLAAAIAAVVAVVMLRRDARKGGLPFEPVLDADFLKVELKRGLFLEGSYLMAALAQRIDLVIVFLLLGPAAAGIYSIALTIGLLAAFVGGSLSYAAFPRMAQLKGDDADRFFFRTARINLAATALSSVAMLVASPFLVRVFYGERFEEAILPTLVLILGACAWSLLSLVARAAWSRGRERDSLVAYSVTVVTMILIDLVLVPRFGLVGAAAGSVVTTGVGLALCWGLLRRTVVIGDESLLPARGDFLFIGRFGLSLVQRLRPVRREDVKGQA